MSHPPTIVITGCTGQVGGALTRLFPAALAPTRAELDLASPDSIRAYFRDLKPRWILNPGAYTAVDKAESEPALAHAINAQAPGVLGEEARRLGAAVIHFSTDYVFDGGKTSPWVETDATNPLGVYGASKLAGEQALAASGATHVILRTSWVYAATGKNFLLTILRLAAQKPELKIVADQHGAPTWSEDLAALTARLVASHTPKTLPGGVFHATSQGETTWHGFASAIVSHANLPNPAAILPIPSSEYPTPARRPQNSRLNCDKLHQTFGLRLPHWQDSLTSVFAELAR